jgi:phosphonate transport system permease protein
MTQGIDPETYFSKVLHTKHQAIETQVTQGVLDAGADYNRNRNAMIEQGLIKAERSKIIWQSAPLPNDAFAVSKALAADKAFVARLQAGTGRRRRGAEEPARPAATALHRFRQPRQRLLQADPRRRAGHRQAAGEVITVRTLESRLLDRFAGRLGFLALALAYALLVPPASPRWRAKTNCRSGASRWPTWSRRRRVRPAELSRCLVRQPASRIPQRRRHPAARREPAGSRTRYLAGLGRATWTTVRIATLGSLLGALLALPLGVLTARNLAAPRALAWPAKAILDVARSIHTLVFGLVLVGIVGLGPTAGILAIALHSMGTYGKLFAEAIESLDMAAIDAVRSVGAGPVQVFFNAVWPSVLPQFVSSHLYVWEFNIRDSTILGIIGAGGLGLLITEATSLFQWGRLATVLIVVVAPGLRLRRASRRIREALL